MSGVDLGELTSDPYDEYFDGLTGAERNRALKPEARPQPIRRTETETQPNRRWLARGAGYGILLAGAVLEGVGILVVMIGEGLQRWGRSLTLPR